MVKKYKRSRSAGSKKINSRSKKVKSVTKKRSATKKSCQNSLKRKIGININEYKKGRFISRQQAVAVSYSQVKKSRPSCSRYFKRK